MPSTDRTLAKLRMRSILGGACLDLERVADETDGIRASDSWIRRMFFSVADVLP